MKAQRADDVQLNKECEGFQQRGSNWGYTLAIFGLDLITIFSALLLVFKGLDQLAKAHTEGLSLRGLFNLAMSLVATLAVFLFTSFVEIFGLSIE
jgi:phosphoglycerol transferase MdoB-like AlkP superfamily enzyme